MSRITNINSSVNSMSSMVNYSFAPNSSLIATRSITNSPNSFNSLATYSYDGLNRITNINHSANSAPLREISYTYNSNGSDQRTRVDLQDGSYWLYTYDELGQVISGNKHAADGSVLYSHDYSFDDIGNRTRSVSDGGSAASSGFDTNTLNQYTSSFAPNFFNLTGSADPQYKVKIHRKSMGEVPSAIIVPKRAIDGSFVHKIVTDTTNSSVTEDFDIYTIGKDDATGKDLVGKETVSQTLPQATGNKISYTYDEDGNLLSDGVWNYIWNAENRLISMTSISSTPSIKLEFAYDYMGRRISKKVYENDVLTSHKKFVYNNYLQIQELDALNSDNVDKQYVWDLSGQLLSGILKTEHGTPNTVYYLHDANKNVVALTTLSDDGVMEVAASYDYSPFGQIIDEQNPSGVDNPFKFSNEYRDSETDLIYYNYRAFDATPGKWLSRETE